MMVINYVSNGLLKLMHYFNLKAKNLFTESLQKQEKVKKKNHTNTHTEIHA